MTAAAATALATPTAPPVWPAQSAYCDDPDTGGSARSCIESACSVTPSVWTSYSSLSSSLCSHWASCTSAATQTGSAAPGAVTTITFSAGPITWGAPGASGWGPPPGGYGWGGGHGKHDGPGGHHGPPGGPPGWWGSAGPGWGGFDSDAYSRYASEWASAWSASGTWSGATVTVTAGPGAEAACGLFDGSPWFVGPRCGWNGHGGFDGWVGWGDGWSWAATSTQTVELTTTGPDGNLTTRSGVATVARAVSENYTTTTTLGSQATSSDTGGSGGSNDNGDADSAGPAGPLPLFGFGFGVEDARVTGLWGALIAVLVGVVALL